LGVTRTLIGRNADINPRDYFGDTPLHQTMVLWLDRSESSQDGRLDVAKFLLEHGADPDTKNDDGWTPLHLASLFGCLKGTQLMLEHGANIHARNKEGRTPLHEVLDRLEDNSRLLDTFLDTARCLLAHGADVNALDNSHTTPLHLASICGCTKIARLLLEHGANVHLENKAGWTPFLIALEQGETNMIQLLSEHLLVQSS
jgi:serine/threonine-protein phosphatase 6 regulatory ankyrin repeat subunit B